MSRAPQKIPSFVVLDFETGGLDATKNPVMSFAALAMDGVSLDQILKYDNLVQPYSDKLQYDSKAMQINGLSVEQCRAKGVPLSQLVDDICKIFTEANIHNSKTARPVIVGHNIDFDKNFLIDIFKRANIDLSKYVSGTTDVFGTFHPRCEDTKHWCMAMSAETTDTDTNFKLQSCCQRASVDLTNAHNAAGDVAATADLWRYVVTRLRSGGSVNVTVSEGKVSVHRQVWEW